MVAKKEDNTIGTGEPFPWDNLFDFSRYAKTEVKMETIRYHIAAVEPLIKEVKGGSP